MSKLSDLRHRAVKAWPFQTLPTLDWSAQGPTYREADPGVIRAAVARAQCRPSGNWFAFAASSQIATKAWGTTVGGGRDRGLARSRWSATGGASRVSASGAGPGHCRGRMRNAGVPVAPSAALGPE